MIKSVVPVIVGSFAAPARKLSAQFPWYMSSQIVDFVVVIVEMLEKFLHICTAREIEEKNDEIPPLELFRYTLPSKFSAGNPMAIIFPGTMYVRSKSNPASRKRRFFWDTACFIFLSIYFISLFCCTLGRYETWMQTDFALLRRWFFLLKFAWIKKIASVCCESCETVLHKLCVLLRESFIKMAFEVSVKFSLFF